MSEQLRIGDAEREQAAADLGEHFAQGRLSVDKHSERLDQVWSARTRAELAPPFSDLPGGEYGVRPAALATAAQHQGSDRQWRPGPFRRFPMPVFVLLAILVSVTVLTHLPIVLIGLLLWFVVLKHRPWNRGGHTRRLRG